MKAAIRNAAVLPVPVCDCPATSLPRRASGRAASWIGGGGDEARVLDAATHRFGQVERGELERAHGVGLPEVGTTGGFAGGFAGVFRPKMRAEMMPSS